MTSNLRIRHTKFVIAATILVLSLLACAVIAQVGPRSWIVVWRGPEPIEGLAFRTSALEQAVRPEPFRQADDAAWRELENALGDSRRRLQAGGFWVGSTPESNSGRAAPDYLIQPVAGSDIAGLPLELSLGSFSPPDDFWWVANHGTAATGWVRSFTAPVPPPPGRKTVFLEPKVAVAYAMSQHAVVRTVLPSLDTSRLSATAERSKTDTVGSAFFLGAEFALTGYVLEGLRPRQPATSSPAFTLLDIAKLAEAVGVGTTPQGITGFRSEPGVDPARILAIGSGWSKPWAGLQGEVFTASGSITGLMRSVMTNGGPAAVRHLLEDDWPRSASGSSPGDARTWIAWADRRIQTVPDGALWSGATATVQERGFVAPYMAALGDLIALPDRIADAGGRQPIPNAFARGVHLSHSFADAPCQRIELNLETAVREVELELPEIAARCLQVAWTGPTYGPGRAVPPIFVSAEAPRGDIAHLLMATATGEQRGLVVESARSGHTAKSWSLAYRPDLSAPGQTGPLTQLMTLGLVAISPRAAETRPISVRITIGAGVVESTGAVSARVDRAPPGEPCQMQTATTPSFIGPVPAMVLIGGTNEETDLSINFGGSDLSFGGLSNVPDRRALDRIVPALACVNAMQSSTQFSAAALAVQREAPVEDAGTDGMCAREMASYTSYLTEVTQRPVRSITGISVTAKDGADPRAMQIPVDAEVRFYDPALPVFPGSGNASGDRRTVTVAMEGVVSFSTRTATRLSGRVSLRPIREAVDQCGANPSGNIETTFDVVAILPLARDAAVIPPDPLEMMDPLLWRMMSPAQRAEAMSAARDAAAEQRRGNGNSGSSSLAAPGADCNCDCAEFNDPARREACGTQCLFYGTISASCVIDREVARGVPFETISAEINQCPATCPSILARASSLCREATWFLTRTCMGTQGQTGRVTPAEEACWIALTTEGMSGQQGNDYRAMLREQLAALDEEGKTMLIIPALEVFRSEGRRCP